MNVNFSIIQRIIILKKTILNNNRIIKNCNKQNSLMDLFFYATAKNQYILEIDKVCFLYI